MPLNCIHKVALATSLLSINVFGFTRYIVTDSVFVGVFLFLAVLLSDGHNLLAPLELLEKKADSLSCCVQLGALEVVVLLDLVVLSLNVLSLHHPLLCIGESNTS